MNSEPHLSGQIESSAESKRLVKQALEQLHWLQNTYPQIKEHYYRSKADFERAEKRKPEVEALLAELDLL